MTAVTVFDTTQCTLGEGPLWHPKRQQLYWFDINAHRLHTRTDNSTKHWQFEEYVSAAGWVNTDQMVIATETAVILFDLITGTHDRICALEADNPVTRCNDGRADPYGGFWIGSMGKNKEDGAGAIHRYYKGELRQLFAPITISNSICFTPDGGHAYFSDTPTGKIWRVALDGHGWPKGDPELFLDLPADKYRPDGAVVDSAGDIWSAQYGHGKVVVFSPDGQEISSYAIPGSRTTCPAFGGPTLNTLFVTTANQQMDAPTEQDGQTFMLEVEATGQHEHRVDL